VLIKAWLVLGAAAVLIAAVPYSVRWRRRASDKAKARKKAIAKEEGSVCRVCGHQGDYGHPCSVIPSATGGGRAQGWGRRPHHPYQAALRQGQRPVWKCTHAHPSSQEAEACASRHIRTLQYGRADWVGDEVGPLKALADRRAARGLVARPAFRARRIELLNWPLQLEMHGQRCFYCGSQSRLIKEHLVPISRGGADHARNIVPACRPCNSLKGTKTMDEFLPTIGRDVPAALEYLIGRHAEAQQAADPAERVLRSGTSEALPPMNARQRMVVHLTVQAIPSIESTSEGRGKRRHVILSSRSGDQRGGY
jgi:hypothetical protein